MELFASRGYFFCRYCGSFHFPDSAPDQGVRVVAETKDPVPCPVCKTKLGSAVLDDAHAVHFCQGCRGVLLDREIFADVIQHRRAWATDVPAEPVPFRKEELARQIKCPKCAAALTAHPYYGPGNVVIDNCTACDVIWLDFGELKQIVDAPGRDRGLRGQIGAASAPMVDPTTTRAIGGHRGHAAIDGVGAAAEGVAATGAGVAMLLGVFTDLFSV